MRTLRLLPLLALITGCVTLSNVLPDDYMDDTAVIGDTFESVGKTKANLYYVDSVDGSAILNGFNATSSATYGKGPAIVARGKSRRIPVRPMRLHLVGQVARGAPIGYLLGAGKNYLVEGDITFTPEINTRYFVSGQLSDMYSAVWIEDKNGNVVSQVVQQVGDAVAEVVDFNDTHVELRSGVMKQSRPDRFVRIAVGESAATVIQKLGEPEEKTIFDGDVATDTSPNVTFVYNNLGSIRFSSRDSIPQYVELLEPVVLERYGAESIAMQLEMAESSTLRELAQQYYREGPKDPDVLDVLGQAIWDKRSTTDKQEIDALAWMCKDLAQSKNSRYRQLLQDVSDHAYASKLRKYAADSLEFLPTSQEQQFMPEKLTKRQDTPAD